MNPFLFLRTTLLVATLVALSLPTVTEPAAARDATIVTTGATPQVAVRADHPAGYKTPKTKKKQKARK